MSNRHELMAAISGLEAMNPHQVIPEALKLVEDHWPIGFFEEDRDLLEASFIAANNRLNCSYIGFRDIGDNTFLHTKTGRYLRYISEDKSSGVPARWQEVVPTQWEDKYEG